MSHFANQLVSSVDPNHSVAYVYGQDGQRSNKYTASGETLYFNKMWTHHTDGGNSLYGGQTSKNIYLGDIRIVTKLNSGENPTYQEESRKQYFYHSDHLGSAAMISDYKGDEYQRLEYTPYGETWVEKTSNTGLEYLPYKFTAKELDAETGLYYYGARYLDPKYSMWISTDPALSDYIPQAGSDTSNLPGMGGIFNHINSNLYHYAGNNPIKYKDPDGRIQCEVQGKYKMRDPRWQDDELSGTTGGKANTLEYAGCAIVASANLISTAGFPDYDPAKVNNECVSKGLVNWEDVGEKVGMEVKAVKNSEFSGSVFAEQNADKDTHYYTLVNVNYDAKGSDHWVGVIGMETIDGTDYLKVSPTSVNDSAVGKESLRGKQGWRKNSEGDILVPTSETKGYVNFTKEINNEN